MHNHRLVPEGIEPSELNKYYNCLISEDYTSVFKACDTIPMPSEWTAEQLVVLAGITKEELTEIVHWYVWDKTYEKDGKFIEEDFDKVLSELISITPLMGLTVEEIKALKELNR